MQLLKRERPRTKNFSPYGRPAHFHSLKKAEISFRGRKHPVQSRVFSPPITPSFSRTAKEDPLWNPALLLMFRHGAANAGSSELKAGYLRAIRGGKPHESHDSCWCQKACCRSDKHKRPYPHCRTSCRRG